MSGHTPGPWEIVQHGTKPIPATIRSCADSGSLYVAEIKCGFECGDRHGKDTPLIAAAPELLKVVKMFIEYGDHKNSKNPYEMAIAVVAKAEGKNQ